MDIKSADSPSNYPASQEYQNFTDGLRHLFTVPKTEIDRREAEWRANHPKSTVKAKEPKKQRPQPCG